MDNIGKLLQQKSEIDLQIEKCKAAIREMVGDAKEKRRFAPTKQFNEIQMNAKRLAQESQKIQIQIGVENRKQKKSNSDSFGECFVKAAKHSLSFDQFSSILRTATEMHNENVRNSNK